MNGLSIGSEDKFVPPPHQKKIGLSGRKRVGLYSDEGTPLS